MKIKSIKKVEPRIVYAVQTSSGTYINDGLFSHNCYGCNVGKNGNGAEYFVAMEKKYGRSEVDRLMKLKWVSKKWKVEELMDIIDEYTEKIKLLEDRDV